MLYYRSDVLKVRRLERLNVEGWENNGFLEEIREMVNSNLKKQHDFKTKLEKGICLRCSRGSRSAFLKCSFEHLWREIQRGKGKYITAWSGRAFSL